MDKKRQRTFYISGKTHGRFKKIVGEQNRDMSIIVEEIIARWSDEHSADSRGERVQMDQAVSLLAKAVCEQLSQKREWAEEALIGAGMGLPGATVFDRRIGHFSAEKQELGSRLAHWVLRRAIDFINHGRKVFLVCDSGTTVFWF